MDALTEKLIAGKPAITFGYYSSGKEVMPDGLIESMHSFRTKATDQFVNNPAHRAVFIYIELLSAMDIEGVPPDKIRDIKTEIRTLLRHGTVRSSSVGEMVNLRLNDPEAYLKQLLDSLWDMAAKDRDAYIEVSVSPFMRKHKELRKKVRGVLTHKELRDYGLD